MQHLKSGRKLGRPTDHREAMLKNMVTSLILHDRLTTTDTRAKELRKIADRLVTLGKKGDLSAVRLAGKTVKSKDALGKLFKELAPRFEGRSGGYTRIVRTGNRKGDNAPMVIIEWVEPLAADNKSAAATAEK